MLKLVNLKILEILEILLTHSRLHIMNGIKVNLNLLHFRHKLGVFDAGHVQQPLAGDGAVLVLVFVREVDHRFDARLNDHLGTLVTGEERHIDAAVGDFLRVLV